SRVARRAARRQGRKCDIAELRWEHIDHGYIRQADRSRADGDRVCERPSDVDRVRRTELGYRHVRTRSQCFDLLKIQGLPIGERVAAAESSRPAGGSEK